MSHKTCGQDVPVRHVVTARMSQRDPASYLRATEVSYEAGIRTLLDRHARTHTYTRTQT
jgi:hypothetical protein